MRDLIDQAHRIARHGVGDIAAVDRDGRIALVAFFRRAAVREAVSDGDRARAEEGSGQIDDHAAVTTLREYDRLLGVRPCRLQSNSDRGQALRSCRQREVKGSGCIRLDDGFDARQGNGGRARAG